jgi:hypothetical protein
MAIIYISTDDQVPYQQTANLLEEFHAIWCPPPSLRLWHGTPCSDQERIALAHRGENYTLLGMGLIRRNNRLLFNTHLLWTEGDIAGIRTRAKQLGYSGPSNMSFLLLDEVTTARLGVSKDIGDSLDALHAGLNVVTEEQFDIMTRTMKAPTRPSTLTLTKWRTHVR